MTVTYPGGSLELGLGLIAYGATSLNQWSICLTSFQQLMLKGQRIGNSGKKLDPSRCFAQSFRRQINARYDDVSKTSTYVRKTKE